MATYTFIGSDLCSGNEHFTLTVSGSANATRRYELNQLLEIPTNPDEAFLLRLLRIHFNGSTKAQIRQALASPGVTISTDEV